MPRKPRDADVRLSDVTVFLTVRATGSVTAAAKTLDTTPSHVSKSIDRLERTLRTKLLVRSGRGVALSTDAVRVMPHLQSAEEALRKAQRRGDSPRDVTVAAPSYLLMAFVPALAATMTRMRFRALQLAPPVISASMANGQFEIALTLGEPKTPPSWATERVGDLPAALFANPALAKKLGRVTAADLHDVPFITPVTFSNGQWVAVDDGCPLSVAERRGGHEAPSIGLALEIAARTPQLAFGPRIAARSLQAMRRLVEVPVAGWNVTSPMSLAVDIDRVTAPELRQLVEVASTLLQ